MKINYYTVYSVEIDWNTGMHCESDIAHFSTNEKAKEYLNRIERKLKSKYLESHYRAIKSANNFMDNIAEIEECEKKCTYQDWLNEYNLVMSFYENENLDASFYIKHTSIDIDDNPEIDFV